MTAFWQLCQYHDWNKRFEGIWCKIIVIKLKQRKKLKGLCLSLTSFAALAVSVVEGQWRFEANPWHCSGWGQPSPLNGHTPGHLRRRCGLLSTVDAVVERLDEIQPFQLTHVSTSLQYITSITFSHRWRKSLSHVFGQPIEGQRGFVGTNVQVLGDSLTGLLDLGKERLTFHVDWFQSNWITFASSSGSGLRGWRRSFWAVEAAVKSDPWL